MRNLVNYDLNDVSHGSLYLGAATFRLSLPSGLVVVFILQGESDGFIKA